MRLGGENELNNKMRERASMVATASSFPAMWGDDLDASPVFERQCPIPDERIRQYLKDCHYHFCLDEEPTEFSVSRLREFFSFSDRQFWILASRDGYGREWDILVGYGRSPFFGEDGHRVWASADLYHDRVTPQEVLLHQFPEYKSTVRKVN